jgi:hypothetical protein
MHRAIAVAVDVKMNPVAPHAPQQIHEIDPQSRRTLLSRLKSSLARIAMLCYE